MATPTSKRPSPPPPQVDEGEDEPPTGRYAALDDVPPKQPVRRATPPERVTIPVPADGPPRKPTGNLAKTAAKGAPASDSDHPTGRPAASDSAPRWQELLDSIMDETDAPDLSFGITDDPDAAFATGPVHGVVATKPRRASNDRMPAQARRPSVEREAEGESPTPLRPPPPPRMPNLGPEHALPGEVTGRRATPAGGFSPRADSGDDLSFQPAFAPRAQTAPRPFTTTARFPSAIPLPLDAPKGDAHSLVERHSVPPGLSAPDPRREMQERHALGDFSGALALAEVLLQTDASDADATSVATECRTRLRQMYVSRLGGLDQVPSMAVPRSELKWLSLHHRAGFLLSQIDGVSTLEEIIDLAGMPEIEALRTLVDLLGQRVIELKTPRGR